MVAFTATANTEHFRRGVRSGRELTFFSYSLLSRSFHGIDPVVWHDEFYLPWLSRMPLADLISAPGGVDSRPPLHFLIYHALYIDYRLVGGLGAEHLFGPPSFMQDYWDTTDRIRSPASRRGLWIVWSPFPCRLKLLSSRALAAGEGAAQLDWPSSLSTF